jgi:nitric oxide reductase NorD protein
VAEPEELLIEGAHLATRVARDAWRRHAKPRAPGTIPLADIRSRLELFITALLGLQAPIVPLAPPSKATWLARLARGRTHDPGIEPFLSGTDGTRLLLPPELPQRVAGQAGAAVYRLLAVEQAARLRHGTAAAALAADALARPWFLLATAHTVDEWIRREAAGLLPTLHALRADALARRAARRRPPAQDTPLEQAIRELLHGRRTPHLAQLPPAASAADCLAWARTAAAATPADAVRHAVEPVWYWGRLVPAATVRPAEGTHAPDDDPDSRRPFRVAEMRRRPKPRQAADDEDDQGGGMWVIRADEPQESVEDPLGMQRPVDRDAHADAEGLADSLSELPDARVVRTPDRAHEVLRSDDEAPRVPVTATMPPGRAAGVTYPEWDYRAGAYRLPGAVVRAPAPALGDPGWAAAALVRHAALARQVRARFARLRPRRARLFAQMDGAEVDVAAYVTAAADLRAGCPIESRFYVASRPARRELSVALLADVSASTDAWVAPGRRIVDIAREALLVVCTALDALGDPYGIFAFSGESTAHVTVLDVKGFDERNGDAVRRRIAALDYDRYTRLGAALRHVTAALARRPACHRLLLVLSDGKPNDVDAYEGRYGVEDTRQAVAEARRQGVLVFCLTIDRDAPRYAGRIFGPGGYAVLRKADQLPAVLAEALRRLIRW